MTQVYLEPNKIPAHLRGKYTGKKFAAEARERMTIPSDAGLWYDGSRATYSLLRLSDGKVEEAVNHNASPWNKERKDVEVELKPGYGVVKHKIFLGKDMGLTFYLHPSDIVAYLPAPITLSDNAKKVLNVIAGYKSAYRKQEYDRMGLSIDDVMIAKNELFITKMITASGAVTVAGLNAR